VVDCTLIMAKIFSGSDIIEAQLRFSSCQHKGKLMRGDISGATSSVLLAGAESDRVRSVWAIIMSVTGKRGTRPNMTKDNTTIKGGYVHGFDWPGGGVIEG